MEMEKKVSRSQPQPQTQDVIDLVEVFHLLLHKWKLLFVAILAGSVLGGAYCTFLLETTYRAEASLYITSSESLLSFSELQLSSALTEDYAYIIKSRTVLERVIDELGLDMDYMLMDTTIKSEDDVERYLGVPLLSSIPYAKNFGKEERK